MTASGHVDQAELSTALKAYAAMLRPWANKVAAYMVADVGRRNERMWKRNAKEIGLTLRHEIENAPTGAFLRQTMEESAELIVSLPLEAAEEVQKLVVNNMPGSARSTTLIDDIMALGSKTEARARTIARTETARCANGLTMARALYVGSEGYIWRTAGDGDVRDSHEEMNGKYVRWDSVPKLSDGTQTHAGMIYNCRCFPDPVLPE